MATSSFVENIRVNNPGVILEYAKALESAENAPIEPVRQSAVKMISDPEELKRIMLRGIEKWERK